jgi:hypothetical protein
VVVKINIKQVCRRVPKYGMIIGGRILDFCPKSWYVKREIEPTEANR